MFVGREQELRKFNEMYFSNNFELAIIYGRRRVGKTTLISKFCRDKRTIFYSALESNAQDNLSAFSSAITEGIGDISEPSPTYSSFNDILKKIALLAKDERLVLVIDEYPWLALSDTSFSSLLQSHIDHTFNNTKLFIILCGSSVSFMLKNVLGEKSPLFGRRTAQFHIKPLSYFEIAAFDESRTAEEHVATYGISGGIPMYVEKLYCDRTLTMDEIIIKNFFTANSYLYDEPANLLKQELREPRGYNAVVTAIAKGASKLNEIATKTSIQPPLCANYLETLIELGIVKRSVSITDKPSSRKTIYEIDDLLFSFWYRFVSSNVSLIERGKGKIGYEERVKPLLTGYLGKVFEKICCAYLLIKANFLSFELLDANRWWGSDPYTKQQEEIDIIGISTNGKIGLFCECKYTNEPVSMEHLQTLKYRANLVHGIQEQRFALFSKSGFTDALRKKADESDSVINLITLEEIYK